MIVVKKYIELKEETKSKLSAYIFEEFGHIPIVQEIEWATPDWTIIQYENDKIASFYNIVEREIKIDQALYKIGGINNVITPKEFRGNGYAFSNLKDLGNLIFNSLNCDLGVLLCADDLIPFYEKLEWYKVDCPVHFKQSSGIKLWTSNTMLLSKTKKIQPQQIDLMGLPW